MKRNKNTYPKNVESIYEGCRTAWKKSQERVTDEDKVKTSVEKLISKKGIQKSFIMRDPEHPQAPLIAKTILATGFLPTGRRVRSVVDYLDSKNKKWIDFNTLEHNVRVKRGVHGGDPTSGTTWDEIEVEISKKP